MTTFDTILDPFFETANPVDQLELLPVMEVMLARLAREYNSTIADEPLMLTVRRTKSPDRLMVATCLWALSIRGRDRRIGGSGGESVSGGGDRGSSSVAENRNRDGNERREGNSAIECFLLPSAEQSALMEAELPSRCKLRILIDGGVLSVDGTPLTASELSTLIRSLLKDVIVRSQGEFDSMSEPVRLAYGGQSLTGSVRSLVAEKHVLVQKIVNQQEAILAQVARELHDAVLGNMMVLERSLTGGRKISDQEMVTLVREASTQLRAICHDLYPRDLKDCGLAPMLQEICTRLSERVGCPCTFTCQGELPSIPDEVLLHVYRIAQECCNNIEKHASASSVTVSLRAEQGTLTLVIADAGKGYDSSIPPIAARSGGSGTSIIRERAELINALLPCHLWVSSVPSEGTTITLRVLSGPALPL